MNTPEAKDLKIYEVTLTATKAATNAEDACKQAGWLIGDCYVNEQKPRRKPSQTTNNRLLVKIPCNLCPFRYAECKKPPDNPCPVQPTAPELTEWLKQATQANLCHYIGKELSIKDYNLGLKWLPMADAIKELTPKPLSPTHSPPH